MACSSAMGRDDKLRNSSTAFFTSIVSCAFASVSGETDGGTDRPQPFPTGTEGSSVRWTCSMESEEPESTMVAQALEVLPDASACELDTTRSFLGGRDATDEASDCLNV